MNEETNVHLLYEIERHAKTIVHHRDDPCPYWEAGKGGCAVSMIHDAEDILVLVGQLRESLSPVSVRSTG